MSEIAYSVFNRVVRNRCRQIRPFRLSVCTRSIVQGNKLVYAETVLHADDHQIFVMSAKYG